MKKSSTEHVEASRVVPYTEQADPHRRKDLTEKALPMETKSRTDMAEPNMVSPKTLQEDPNRKKDRNESVLPKLT